MDYISSKNIFLLTRDTLKLIDKRLMNHGTKTGYILYQMLKSQNTYEMFEIAEYVMLASLHDIGAYKTEDLNNFLQFEIKDELPHAIYGYLFLKYLSPFSESAKIVLYHGSDYAMRKERDTQNDIVCDYLCLAEVAEIHMTAMGKEFKVEVLKPYIGKNFSQETYDIFCEVCKECNFVERFMAKDYTGELDELMDYIMFTNEQKMQAMEMLMYCLTFRDRYKVIDSVTTVCLCKEFAKYLKLSEEEKNKLFYAAVVHDIGMLSIPKEIIDTDKKLTPKQIELMRGHIQFAEKILKDRLDAEIIEVALSHHERLDGSGYPKGLHDKQMNTMQKILQLADALTAMINGRKYRMPMEKDEIFKELKNAKAQNIFSTKMIDFVLDNYDMLVNKVRIETNQILSMHNTIHNKYKFIYEKYKKMNK